jgi:hypothetical protein
MIKWMLVFIVTSYSSDTGYVEPRIEAYYSYDTMKDCFKARETLLVKIGGEDTHYPMGTIGVCFRRKSSD